MFAPATGTVAEIRGRSEGSHCCVETDTLTCTEHHFCLIKTECAAVAVITKFPTADGRANTASGTDLEAALCGHD